MYKKLFLYKLLVNLKDRNKTIDINSVYMIHSDFINTLESYNLINYANEFRKADSFVNDIILIFTQFELGIYLHDSLYFCDDSIILKDLLNFEIDVNNKLINELALIFSIYLNEVENNQKKQLIKN